MKLSFSPTVLLLQASIMVLGYDQSVSADPRIRKTKYDGKKGKKDGGFTKVEGTCTGYRADRNNSFITQIFFEDFEGIDSGSKLNEICEPLCHLSGCRSYSVDLYPEVNKGSCAFYGAPEGFQLDLNIPGCSIYTLDDPASLVPRQVCTLDNPAFTTGLGCVIQASGGNPLDPADEALALPCLGCLLGELTGLSCSDTREITCDGTLFNGPCAGVCVSPVCGSFLPSSVLCYGAQQQLVNTTSGGNVTTSFGCNNEFEGEFVCPP